VRRRPSWRAPVAAIATLAIALVLAGSAYAATILYFQGNLGFVQSSGGSSGQHVAIARGWGAANWGPSGPAGSCVPGRGVAPTRR